MRKTAPWAVWACSSYSKLLANVSLNAPTNNFNQLQNKRSIIKINTKIIIDRYIIFQLKIRQMESQYKTNIIFLCILFFGT